MFRELRTHLQNSTWQQKQSFADVLQKSVVVVLQISSKKDSDTDVFLWILQIFLEHRFYRTPLRDCFCDSYFQES